MSDKILVTYASRSGTTAGVANAIGKKLAASGARVEVLPMHDVKDLTPYGAVVMGSAIQGAKWLPEAMQFVQTHRAELAQRRVATFLVCMTLAMPNGENYRKHVAEFLAPVRALINPVSEGCFAGTLDISNVPSLGDRLKFRLSVMLGVWKEGDHRDWKAIGAWADSLRPLLV